MIVTGYLIDREGVESSVKSEVWADERKYTGLIIICYASLRSERAFKTKPIAVSGQKCLGEFTDYIKRK